MKDRHLGRQTPAFNIEGRPETFIAMIQRHGVLSRIMRARKCPCLASTGSPNVFCNICRGDGMVFDFQRKCLQPDEDSDINPDGSVVYPFRVPLIEPLTVERLLPPEQGGITRYNIDSYTDKEIRISGEPRPLQYEKMRVSYYFDRFEYSQDELAEVNPNTKTLTVAGTKFDDGYRSSNYFGIHGDIVIVDRIYDTSKGHEFKQFHFRKNQIYLSDGEPEPTPGKTLVSYYYVPPARVLTADITSRQDKNEKWTSDIPQGDCRIAIEPWYELGEGDLITLLSPTIFKNDVIIHNAAMDKLFEFDVGRVDDLIFDQEGNRYYHGQDFILRNFRDLVWIGKQPAPGKRISVRYGYHPTFVVFIDNPMPNTLENKQYPQTVNAKLWAKTMAKDTEMLVGQNMEFGYSA